MNEKGSTQLEGKGQLGKSFRSGIKRHAEDRRANDGKNINTLNSAKLDVRGRYRRARLSPPCGGGAPKLCKQTP